MTTYKPGDILKFDFESEITAIFAGGAYVEISMGDDSNKVVLPPAVLNKIAKKVFDEPPVGSIIKQEQGCIFYRRESGWQDLSHEKDSNIIWDWETIVDDADGEIEIIHTPGYLK